MNRLSVRIATIALAVVVPLGGISVANAAETDPVEKPSSLVVDHVFTDDEIARAAAEVEHLFTVLLMERDGVWTVNYEQARIENVDPVELSRIAEALNHRMLGHSVSSQAYRHCVLDYVGFGGISGAVAGAGSRLDWLMISRDWKQVAWVLGRVVGVQALKGGVAGMAVSLAAAGAWCATPFAR